MVSAVIPARNEEASIARAVESVAAQAEVDEVIVVDDQSTDRTSAILTELALRIPKLKVVRAGELPSGWVGKNYAVSLGAAEAKGEWLLFTDADTYHLPGAMRRALADAGDNNAALVSYSPEQEMERWWERALTQQVYWMLSKRYPFNKVNNPVLPDAAANGQFIVVRRGIYQSLGGHRAIASDVLEDVALARLAKRAGFRLYFASGLGIVRTRMYRSFGAMWNGWTKNLYGLLGRSKPALFAELANGFVLVGIVLVCTFWGRDFRSWIVIAGAIAWFAARMTAFGRYLRENRYPVSDIKSYAVGVYLYSVVLIASWWKSTRGAVEWKGRRYAAAMQRGS